MYLWVAKTLFYQKLCQMLHIQLFHVKRQYKTVIKKLHLFCALALLLRGNEMLGKEISEVLEVFINRIHGLSPNQFQGLNMNDIQVAEGLLALNILLRDVLRFDGNIIRELDKQNDHRYENTVPLLMHSNHDFHKTNNIAVLKSFPSPTCDMPISTKSKIWSNNWTNSVNKSNMSIRRTFTKSEKLCFTKSTHSVLSMKIITKLFQSLPKFRVKSICVQEDTLKDAETKIWVANYVPISVSISSYLLQKPIFFCRSDPHHLLASFIGGLEGLASQSETQMKLSFLVTETIIKFKQGNFSEKINECPNRRENSEELTSFAMIVKTIVLLLLTS